MAGEGFVTHMITSLKNNKRARISTFKKLKDFKKAKKAELHFEKKANPLELKKIKDKILKENETAFFKKIILLVVSIILILIF